MISSNSNAFFNRKQLLNNFNKKIDFEYCADDHVKKSLKNLDHSSKDINELINKLEVLITGFDTQNKNNSN